MLYQIRIKGHIRNLTACFENMSVTLEDNGDSLLKGSLDDQAALVGLLRKIHDLGIPLVSVIPIQQAELADFIAPNAPDGSSGPILSGKECDYP